MVLLYDERHDSCRYHGIVHPSVDVGDCRCYTKYSKTDRMVAGNTDDAVAAVDEDEGEIVHAKRQVSWFLYAFQPKVLLLAVLEVVAVRFVLNLLIFYSDQICDWDASFRDTFLVFMMIPSVVPLGYYTKQEMNSLMGVQCMRLITYHVSTLPRSHCNRSDIGGAGDADELFIRRGC